MRLKELRKREKITREELAKACGISSTAVYNYENDINEPTLSVLKLMAKKLNVAIDTLCDLDGEILDLKMLNDEKRKLIKDILNLDASYTGKVQAFIYGLNSK